MDSGVLFHTLCVTTTNCRRHLKDNGHRHSLQFFALTLLWQGPQTATRGLNAAAIAFVNTEKLIGEKVSDLVQYNISRNNPIM